MKKLGVIVNPVAGMGGRVGLKGSDGDEIQKKARELGAKPESPLRAIEALKVIARLKDQVEIIAYPHEMGADEAREAGFDPRIVGSISSGATSPEDTVRAVHDMVAAGADMILFAGGDGTARNIYTALGSGSDIPVLGIPAGVKIHSAVYAVNPRSAGEVTALFLEGKAVNIREAEVMDIDEEAFREGRVSAQLYGYLNVPENKKYVQSVKSGTRSEQAEIQGMAAEIVANMKDDVIYVIGPGTTTRSIMQRLELPYTLLGVDVVLNKQILANDVNEQQLYDLVKGKKVHIVVTAIGGQGHIFGRGNQQISPRIIRAAGKENITVVASRDKLTSIMPRPLLVDTGDPELDRELSGYYRIVAGWQDILIYKAGLE
jgi:predicted polyphosphate/ATP-dependent NAD kinase